MSKEVTSELNVADLQKLQAGLNQRVLIIKFGADWCGPCKKIAPMYYEYMKTAPNNILFADIDVDDNIDLFMALKKNKMVNGIPVFFAYFGDSKRDKWFIPEDSVIGADEISVKSFFDRCSRKATELQTVYTYYS
jgi:thiol-disulfide isomerase/thioredoxin